jgi:hypothetical protein
MPKKKTLNALRRNHNPTKRNLNAKEKGIKKNKTQTKTQIRGHEIPKKKTQMLKKMTQKAL